MMPFRPGDPNINRKGRPTKEREQQALRIFNEVVTQDRFKEIVTLMYLDAKGFRAVFSEEGGFIRIERDPSSTHHSRYANRKLIVEYKLGKPSVPIEFSPDFGDLIKQFAKNDEKTLDSIISQAEDLLKRE